MNLAYDTSDCYLSSPSGKLICKLNGIDLLSARLSKDVSDIGEFSFDLFKYIDIDGHLVESNGYDNVKNKMYLYLTNFGWYKIVDEPEINFESGLEKKIVKSESVECELLQYDLVGLKINTGEIDSIEYLVEGNVGKDGLAKEYILFYRPDKPELSLLNIILEKVRGWKIGHVDESLKNKKFSFDISSKPIHSFIRDELQKQARCIFTFDNNNRTINAYNLETFGKETSIYLSFRNLVKTIDITCDDRSIYTCYNVAGGEGMENINQVNFGSSYIEDLSYYAHSPYMDETLIAKYKGWLAYREQNRPSYIALVKEYNYYNAIALELKNRVPISDLTNTWSGYTIEELERYKFDYEARIETIDEEFERTGKDIKQYPIYNTYIQYKQILTNINEAIAIIDTEQELDSENWLNNTDLYGVDELSYKSEAYMEQLHTFSRKYYIDEDNNYRTYDSLTIDELKKYSSEDEYNEKRDLFKKTRELYLSFNQAYKDRKQEYKTANEQAKLLLENIKTIQNCSLIENYPNDTFTDEELDVLNRLKNFTDYKNENIVYVQSYDTEDNINTMIELLEDAKEQLAISSQPQISFNIDIDNLIAVSEFHQWANILDVGIFIYLELRDDYKVKLRVTNISGINPFDNQASEFKISFSNMIKGISGIDDFTYLLNNSIMSSKNSISVDSSSDVPNYVLTVDNIKLSTNGLNKIAKSQVFQDSFKTAYNSIVLPMDEKINEIRASGSSSGSGGSNFHTIVNTNSNLIISKNSEKEILRYKLTATADSDIILLATIPFESDLDGQLILRYYFNDTLAERQVVKDYFSRGNNVLSVCNHFFIKSKETITVKLTIQSCYYESEERKHDSRLAAIEEYINTGTFNSVQISTTIPTVRIEPESIRSAVMGSNLVISKHWDGTITLEDTFNSFEFADIPVLSMNDNVSVNAVAEKNNSINESFGLINFSGLSIVGLNDEIITNEVIDNYTFNTSKSEMYEYNSEYVSNDTSFKMKTSDIVASTPAPIDDGKLRIIDINTDKYKSVTAINLEKS